MFSPTQEQLDKRRFIHRMGPYYLQAQNEEREEDFFILVFTHYRERWPIDPSKYFDNDFMNRDMERQKKVRKSSCRICLHINLDCQSLVESIKMWSGMASFEADKHWLDLFKHQKPIEQVFYIYIPSRSMHLLDFYAQYGRCVQYFKDTKPMDRDDNPGSSSAHHAPLGSSQQNPIDVVHFFALYLTFLDKHIDLWITGLRRSYSILSDTCICSPSSPPSPPSYTSPRSHQPR